MKQSRKRLSAFPGFYPLLELNVFFVFINCIYLISVQIHALFYFNQTIYSGLLIFCCQNIAINHLKLYNNMSAYIISNFPQKYRA